MSNLTKIGALILLIISTVAITLMVCAELYVKGWIPAPPSVTEASRAANPEPLSIPTPEPPLSAPVSPPGRLEVAPMIRTHHVRGIAPVAGPVSFGWGAPAAPAPASAPPPASAAPPAVPASPVLYGN